jgi:CBS domain-containing protein
MGVRTTPGIGRSPARDLAVWPDPIPVRRWMRKRVVTVRPTTSLDEAGRLLRTRRIRHLPVRDARGRLVGIVTDRDLRQAVFDPGAGALAALRVRDVMTWAVLTVTPDTDVRHAARLMREQKIGAVPVVEDGRLVGMLTETDVLAALEALLAGRVRRVRPARAAAGGDYDLGFPLPEAEDPWRNEGPGD